jgi:MFS family permease
MSTNHRLWNKNFTIVTVGSAVSMLGNAVSGFAVGLLILDYTQSVFLYSLTMVLYSLPKIIMPFVSGPMLDKFSRKNTIVTLDFISAFLFLLITLVSIFNLFHYAVILVLCILMGSIDSVYTTAFQSLYPLLITKENYRKAYSIEGMIGTIAAISVPIAAWVYQKIGTTPLFIFNAATFLVAAIFETMIRVDETQIDKLGIKFNLKSYKQDFKEGIKYLKLHKGLLYITLFYVVIRVAGSTGGTLMLPYFKNTQHLGIWMYMYVGAAAIVGRIIGGSLHYNIKIPASKKYQVVVIAFFAIAICEGTYMWMSLPVMLIFMFGSGILSITTYNIRMSSTQNYIPNEIRGRFNGTFQTLTVLGGSLGGLVAGALAEYFAIPFVVLGAYILVVIAIFTIFIRGGKSIRKIYNVEF